MAKKGEVCKCPQCDTAFVGEADLRFIVGAGFASRILLGSDFPITHYFRNNYPPEGSGNDPVSLQARYREDVKQLLLYNQIILSHNIDTLQRRML
jgi:hypothetical protein